jgi:hypothetical protein
MIIFGTRSMDSTVSNGMFHCPRCAVEQPYAHKAVRRWFTLYFIPLIPMGQQGEYIECNSCAGTYEVDVLTYDHAAEQAKTFAAMRRIAVLTLAEAGKLKPENISALCQAINATGDVSCSTTHVEDDCRLAQQAQAKLLPFAQSNRDNLSEDGKVFAVQLCIHALRGGNSRLDDRSLTALSQLTEGLHVSPDLLQQLRSDEYKLLS